jgi:hypothetical protein
LFAADVRKLPFPFAVGCSWVMGPWDHGDMWSWDKRSWGLEGMGFKYWGILTVYEKNQKG